MGKQIKLKQTNNKNIHKKSLNQEKELIKDEGPSKGTKYVKFFTFLKHLHESKGKQQPNQLNNQRSLQEITEELMIFFNLVKKYTQNELSISIICLANLLSFIRNKVDHLQFQKEFKNKLKNFLPSLQQPPHDCTDNHHSKITAIFYILAVLIYKQRINQSPYITDLNKAIYSDPILVKSLLSISIFPEVRLSKCYGIVLHYVSNKCYRKKEKENLIRSLILNIRNVTNESTLINFIVYLRLQKNKIRINLEDVMEGGLVEFLLELYPKYIETHQSELILDYLHHLLVLFPQFTATIITPLILTQLIQTTSSLNYHPPQETPLLSLINFSLNLMTETDKAQFIDFCLKFMFNKSLFTFKLLDIIIDYEIDMGKLMMLLQEGFANDLLDMIRRVRDGATFQAIKMMGKLIRKVSKCNSCLGGYLRFHLSTKLKAFEWRQMDGINVVQLLINTPLQY